MVIYLRFSAWFLMNGKGIASFLLLGHVALGIMKNSFMELASAAKIVSAASASVAP